VHAALQLQQHECTAFHYCRGDVSTHTAEILYLIELTYRVLKQTTCCDILRYSVFEQHQACHCLLLWYMLRYVTTVVFADSIRQDVCESVAVV
jgi:hypothetical protein